MTEETLRDRVRERLDALGINPFEAARRAGFERSFVNDLLIGRKKSVRGDSLLKLADALHCDPTYLAGMQAEPRSAEAGEYAWPAAVDACAAGVWRDPGARPPASAQICAATPPDPRHNPASQRVFYVADDHAEAEGIRHGSCVVAYRPTGSDGVRDGDLVVLRRRHGDDGSVETAIWRLNVTLDGLRVVPLDGGEPMPLTPGGERRDELELVGIVTMSVLMF